jgi:hypothetical protein
MLNMRLETSINSIPYLIHMNLHALVDDFVKFYNQGYDINDDDVQSYIYKKNCINFNILTDNEKDYIAQAVERRINK